MNRSAPVDYHSLLGLPRPSHARGMGLCVHVGLEAFEVLGEKATIVKLLVRLLSPLRRKVIVMNLIEQNN
jgi:hypothetical protein